MAFTKSEKGTLSITESGYSAITEVCCKIIFSMRLYCLWELFSNALLP